MKQYLRALSQAEQAIEWSEDSKKEIKIDEIYIAPSIELLLYRNLICSFQKAHHHHSHDSMIEGNWARII